MSSYQLIQLNFFIDGEEKFSDSNLLISDSIYLSTKYIKIGADKTGNSSFDGAIRDFRMYNKAVTDVQALSEEMVVSHNQLR